MLLERNQDRQHIHRAPQKSHGIDAAVPAIKLERYTESPSD